MNEDTVKKLEEGKYSHEIEVSSFLEQELKLKDNNLNDEQKAEHWAFNFCSNYTEKNTSWGKYYGPLFVFPNGKGQMVEFPSINLLNQNILDYWQKRAKESINPILKNRYADLFFEFNDPKDFSIISKIIESAIEISKNKLQDPIYIKEKLRRALDLCLLSNNEYYFKLVSEQIINLDIAYKGDDSPGLWGFALKWLVVDNTKKNFKIEDNQIKDLVNNLEERLLRLAKADNKDLYSIEHNIICLSDYYKKISDEDNLKRLLNLLYKEYSAYPEYNEDQFSRGHYTDKLISILSEYVKYSFVSEIIFKVDSDVNNIHLLPEMKMQEISVEQKISNADIEKYKEGIFDNDLEKTLMRIAVLHVIKKEPVEKSFKELVNEHPIQFLSTSVVLSEFGAPAITFKDIETEEGYQMRLMDNFAHHYIKFNNVFLKMIVDDLKSKYEADKIVDVLLKSPVFKDADILFIKRVVRALFENDFIVVSGLAVPLIESSIRNIFLLNKKSFLSKNHKYDGYHVKTLDTLLDDGLINQVFGGSKVDVEYYLKSCLSNPCGLNLRNDFAHGLNKSGFLQEMSANRLFHIIILLSMIRINQKSEGGTDKVTQL